MSTLACLAQDKGAIESVFKTKTVSWLSGWVPAAEGNPRLRKRDAHPIQLLLWSILISI